MILDASLTILFSKEVLFKVEFQFLFCEILDCLKLFKLKFSVLTKQHIQAK